MKNKAKVPSWLCKVILKQERRLRKEYEEQYLFECKEKCVIPWRYAVWRRKRIEPKILEMLLEENQLNTPVFEDKLNESELIRNKSFHTNTKGGHMAIMDLT